MDMAFYKYMFTPKLFKEYDGSQKLYEARSLEQWGDQIISTLNFMWSLGYYTSPFIVTFLYKRGYFVAESISSLAKFSTGIGIIVLISLFCRGMGRCQNRTYVKFAKCLENAKLNGKNVEARRQLRFFDFEFSDWPVDFSVREVEENKLKKDAPKSINRTTTILVSSLPCQIMAYLAIHSFGIRMIYPGSIKLIQSYLYPMLIQGRTKLISEEQGIRNKVQSADKNYVDTIFIDRRKIHQNGKYLVLCSEGNAGFYEIGIMTTPLDLSYSVLGWNHPGFGGSTGLPYPDQDINAIDAVMQFAIHSLGFSPENIILFGWSIGGYSSLQLATKYPEVKGIILDATFDDLLHLALPRMPQALAGIVKIAIREHVNLNNLELINLYPGPVTLIRRTEDEVICSEDMNISTNRGNFLLLHMLKYRFPKIFENEQIEVVTKIISKAMDSLGNTSLTDANDDQLCTSLLVSYLADNVKAYPLEIGVDYTSQQKNQMAKFLLRKHFIDFKSTHCTPLPIEFFQLPWDVPNSNDNDFVLM